MTHSQKKQYELVTLLFQCNFCERTEWMLELIQQKKSSVSTHSRVRLKSPLETLIKLALKTISLSLLGHSSNKLCKRVCVFICVCVFVLVCVF